MRRDVYLIMVAFWTSTPLFAVFLALSSWPPRNLGWPGVVLWSVVVTSSMFMTVREAFLPPVSEKGEHVEARRTSEWLVYPIIFVLASGLVGFQLLSF